MLSIFARGVTRSGGLNRRTTRQAGGWSLFGIAMPDLMRAAEPTRGKRFECQPARGQSVIQFHLLGGSRHTDVLDRKPNALAEMRGEFQPIPTSLPGLQICEHLAEHDRQGRPVPTACIPNARIPNARGGDLVQEMLG